MRPTLAAAFALVLSSTLAGPTFSLADEPSAFATDAPTLSPARERGATAEATATPTLENQPPIVMSEYAPYTHAGTGSIHGRLSVRIPSGDSTPPDGFPIYAIPATAYTNWYMGFHFNDFYTMGPRTQVIKHGGLQGLMERGELRKHGYAGIPDVTKPVPFTNMDPRVFHVVRTSRASGSGRFNFSGLPAGRYYVLSHWPIQLENTTANTTGSVGYFGDYSGQTTVEKSSSFYLIVFGIVAPIAVEAGKTTTVIPDGPNARLTTVGCGPTGCGRFAIDQWLSIEERNL